MGNKKCSFKLLGQNIHNAREKRKITLEELAQKTGIHKQYLFKIERGEAYDVNITHCLLIATILKVKIYTLVEGL